MRNTTAANIEIVPAAKGRVFVRSARIILDGVAEQAGVLTYRLDDRNLYRKYR